MGNTPSTYITQYGGLMIAFEKSYYYPGEVVKGNIYLQLSSDFPAQGVQLNIQTVEHTQFYVTEYYYVSTYRNGHHRRERRSRRVLRQGNAILFATACPIFHCNDGILRGGQYVFPFSFVLPNNLPGSFEYYDSSTSAYVKYEITSTILSLNRGNDLVRSAILVVRQPSQHFQYPTKLSDTRNITTWCCINKGTATLNISYPKNHYTKDETMEVSTELVNSRCKLNAKCIKIQLWQRITLRESYGRTTYLNRLVSEVRNDSLFVNNINLGQRARLRCNVES